MIDRCGIGASGRGDRADGWILLHAPTAAVAGLPPIAEWLDQLGLTPDGAGQLRFGSQMFDWMERDAATLLLAEMRQRPRLVGLANPPDIDEGLIIGLRCGDGAEADIAAIQRLCALAGLIAHTWPGAAIGWLPARIWSSVALFGDSVSATERQGLPPVMHLVGFDVAQDGWTSVTTAGLAWFCGHELRLTAPSPVPAREAIRRAARLAVDAMVHRGLAEPMTVEGIDKGEKLIIGPVADGLVPVELCPPPD